MNLLILKDVTLAKNIAKVFRQSLMVPFESDLKKNFLVTADSAGKNEPFF